MYTHTHTATHTRHTQLAGAMGRKGGRGSYTHCESTLDIPGMSEDCQIRPDGIEAFLCGIRSGWEPAAEAQSRGIQASDWPAERGCQSEQAEGLKLFKQLPQDQEDHSPWLRERLLETQIWEGEEKDVMWDRLKSTIRPQPPALSFCLGIKNKTSYLDKDYVSVQTVMIRQVNTEVIKWWIM